MVADEYEPHMKRTCYAEAMTFTVGEEVLYEGVRYVISEIETGKTYRYRLLATTPKGARFVWARQGELEKMINYTTPIDDTASIP
jgi:hypothetical protein